VAARCRDCGGREWDTEGRCRECRAFPTLGYMVLDLVEDVCVIPDREEAGEPFVPTDEQALIFLHHYRVNPHSVRDARGLWRLPFFYPRGSQIAKPQKWGKAPISSALVCAEAHPEGPVLFDGWDAEGQPVGRPWPAPHIQITACSEDQSDNVWRALQPMIELGPLASVFPDTGLTRINLPSGGLIEPVTASAVSRLGQRIHLSVQDQTESWLAANGGHKLRDSQRRGLAGTGGRFFETPNAWDPVENSVAQQTYESEPGVFKTYKNPPAGSVRNKAERRRVLRHEYGDSLIERGGWIDLDRIDVEIEALLEHDPAQAERWFMNRCQASEGAAFDLGRFQKLKRPGMPPPGSIIVVGVDGARHHDAIAAVGTDVKTGFQWPLCIIERPEKAPDDYEHDLSVLDGAMVEAMQRYVVWRVYIDPQYIDNLVEKWSNRYGPKRVIEWMTYRPRQIAWAVREYEQAISGGDVHHDGNEMFVAHVGHARKRMLTVKDDKERLMHTLSKDSVRSLRKIDAAMAAVLSWKARSDAIELGIVRLDGDPQVPVEPEPAQAVWRPGDDVPEPSLWRQPVASDGYPMGFMG
jgi:hypothetical protein